ncbi:MAPEG family protein [Parvibium lacunae]|uniref:Glutathione metabolism protein n=1 Tax=Parvibium lacunae TaxID=1888893 RepID=A0A368L086_9BURK|nr:MAPEG family protein [Parvibium lacunae]RCS56980.1 glutathione metabolism protein [Parvibium lacunae]
MKIGSIYAAILALLFIYLSVRTIRTRRSLRISLGHAENAVMLRAIRAHANFSEYVPFALILLFLAENGGANAWFIHILGMMLVIARALHAYGVSREPETFTFRVSGMALTFSVLGFSTAYLLISATVN